MKYIENFLMAYKRSVTIFGILSFTMQLTNFCINPETWNHKSFYHHSACLLLYASYTQQCCMAPPHLRARNKITEWQHPNQPISILELGQSFSSYSAVRKKKKNKTLVFLLSFFFCLPVHLICILPNCLNSTVANRKQHTT